ncbi:MAG: S8 family serine peptidase, partial [Planctomycetota bacterium]
MKPNVPPAAPSRDPSERKPSDDVHCCKTGSFGASAFGSSAGIERCESRLALSASLAGGVLLEGLGFETDAPDSDLESTAISSPVMIQDQANTNGAADGSDSSAIGASLIDQATALRDAHGLSGAGQTVAVIDSGVAWDHTVLGGGFGPGYRVVGGWDFAENDADPYDDGPAGYHGTHVAGLLAGDGEQFVGVAPGADLVALRVFDDQGSGQLEWIESALQWVHENQNEFESPITTINLSIGAVLSDANRDYAMGLLEDEFLQLRNDGILVFAAAGNSFDSADPSELLYPAASP